jgi:hypothetical protein
MVNEKTIRKMENLAVRTREDCINAFLGTWLEKRGVLHCVMRTRCEW